MNYAIVYLGAILIFSTVYYVIAGRKYYTGPLIEAEIGEDEMRTSGDRSSDDEMAQKPEKEGDVVR